MTSSFSTPPLDPRRGDAIESMLRGALADDADARRITRTRKRTRGILIASFATVCVVAAAGIGFAATRGTASHDPGGNIAVPTSQPSSRPSITPQPTDSNGIVDPAGSASPVPTPTPTANTPTDVDTWQITTAGIGPLKPGMPLADADAIAKAAGLTVTDCGGGLVQGTHFYDLPDGTQIVVGLSSPSTVGYVAVDGLVAANSSTGTLATPHGIHIGSTSDELRSTYSGLVSVSTYPSETGYGLSDGAGHWIDFEVDNASATVQAMFVSSDNYIPPEFCG
ncbi:hypothetical protein [Frondihabitans australicus]|uniref:Uncharacterized protein n=1 Tax=Frondihabitans australicus TaxID=386892 RepID=A0A495IEG2_9MICO|nr:hypothetical protein [Frondihabitans australicus]RKR74169.1 hypothetical protein C8E83_1277 [Frondihabitans australicus]